MKKPKYSSEVLELSKEIVENCTNCKRCMKDCVMMNDFGDSPQEIFGSFIKEGDINPIIPYSCNLCNKCTTVCPKKLKITEAFVGIREAIIKENHGKFILKGHKAVNIHQLLSFGFMNIFTTRRK